MGRHQARRRGRVVPAPGQEEGSVGPAPGQQEGEGGTGTRSGSGGEGGSAPGQQEGRVGRHQVRRSWGGWGGHSTLRPTAHSDKQAFLVYTRWRHPLDEFGGQ